MKKIKIVTIITLLAAVVAVNGYVGILSDNSNYVGLKFLTEMPIAIAEINDGGGSSESCSGTACSDRGGEPSATGCDASGENCYCCSAVSSSSGSQKTI